MHNVTDRQTSDRWRNRWTDDMMMPVADHTVWQCKRLRNVFKNVFFTFIVYLQLVLHYEVHAHWT